MYSKKLEHTTEVIYCYSDVACPFRSYLAFHDSCLVTDGVGEIVDSTEESEDESGSTRERESSSTEESEDESGSTRERGSSSTEESEDESGSTRERGSSSTEESEEYEALSEKVKEVHCSKN